MSKRALQSDRDQESYRLRNPLGPSCATCSVANHETDLHNALESPEAALIVDMS